jgi:hypothetical protein
LTTGEAKVGSQGVTFSERGVAADEAAVGSGRRVPFEGRLVVAEVTAGLSKEELMIDAATIGSGRLCGMTGVSISAEGLSRAVRRGSRRVTRALTGASTSSGTSKAESFWHGGSSLLQMSTTTGCEKSKCD